ncbi:MAG: transposase [Calothrix sp. MO_167.B12]|nr:transposase [Calothrix sp. MO_167.B12]
MTFTLTYEFKLKPTADQKEIFNEWLETNRQVYNYALGERKDWYKSRACDVNSCSIKSQYIISADAPRPTYNSQAKALTEAKKQYPHLKRVGSQVLQQTLKRVETAFTSMWERNFGFPRFKKRGRMRSFVFPQFKNNPVMGNKIKLPVIGVVGFRKSRPIPEDAKVKQVRIVKRVSGWYAMITLQWDVNVPQRHLLYAGEPVHRSGSPMPHGKALGVDVGLTSMVATSNGLLVKRPRFFVDAERKLKLLQQRVSRKPKGSNNWHKALGKVAKLHEYVANCRKDWHRKLSHQLCDGVGMIFVEDLNLVGLSRGMLGKHCLDAGFGQFFNILEQTCFKRGVYFQKVDARKTSQICPNCQHETGKKTLAERVHKCDNCGYTTDRDVAASQVVLIRGLAAVGHTVKMLSEGKAVALPMMKESQCL